MELEKEFAELQNIMKEHIKTTQRTIERLVEVEKFVANMNILLHELNNEVRK